MLEDPGTKHRGDRTLRGIQSGRREKEVTGCSDHLGGCRMEPACSKSPQLFNCCINPPEYEIRCNNVTIKADQSQQRKNVFYHFSRLSLSLQRRHAHFWQPCNRCPWPAGSRKPGTLNSCSKWGGAANFHSRQEQPGPDLGRGLPHIAQLQN